MLSTFVTIVVIFTVILTTHNYVLDIVHRDALREPKSDSKAVH